MAALEQNAAAGLLRCHEQRNACLRGSLSARWSSWWVVPAAAYPASTPQQAMLPVAGASCWAVPAPLGLSTEEQPGSVCEPRRTGRRHLPAPGARPSLISLSFSAVSGSAGRCAAILVRTCFGHTVSSGRSQYKTLRHWLITFAGAARYRSKPWHGGLAAQSPGAGTAPLPCPDVRFCSLSALFHCSAYACDVPILTRLTCAGPRACGEPGRAAAGECRQCGAAGCAAARARRGAPGAGRDAERAG